ncbi:hypothetical protein ACFX1R_049601 [Malus domestica]
MLNQPLQICHDLVLALSVLLVVDHDQSPLILSTVNLVFLSNTNGIHSLVPTTTHDILKGLKLLNLISLKTSSPLNCTINLFMKNGKMASPPKDVTCPTNYASSR